MLVRENTERKKGTKTNSLSLKYERVPNLNF